MQISVIIPVYNAAPYVERAVRSALDQAETAEVILVEDASPDDSLAVCERLVREHVSVRLIRHPDGGNHGAGASRSLGVREAQGEWIAFLDADDFFLPGRFTVAAQRLAADPALDGVCECVGAHFDTELGRERAVKSRCDEPVTFAHPVGPDEMFLAHMPVGDVGYFHLDGLTVRRQAVIDTGLFADALRLHQDTEFAIRLTACCRLTTGVIDRPVAMRGMHDANRISAERTPLQWYRHRVLMWRQLYPWAVARLEGDGMASRPTNGGGRLVALEAAMVREIGRLWENANCRVRGRVQLVRQLAVLVAAGPVVLRSRAMRRALLRLAVRP